MSSPEVSQTSFESRGPDRLTIFAFLWACQAIVHQDFYSAWMHEPDIRGWLLSILAIGVLLRPRSLPLFCGMLSTSIVYNVVRWPFVVNHILVESVINLTILWAVATVALRGKAVGGTDEEYRDAIYSRFAPVIGTMLVLVYWFAFLAKLNTDFLDPDVSCVVSMYGDLIRRFPFLPDNTATHRMAITLTLVVEALIPLLLTFRKTRPLGVAIGIPFHVVLGLVGHRTFSALAFAIYVLFCMEGVRPVIAWGNEKVRAALSAETRRRLLGLTRVVVATGLGTLVFLEVTGASRASLLGIIKVYQVSWLLWCVWSLIVGVALLAAIMILYRRDQSANLPSLPQQRPGLIWSATLIVLLLGFSQYLGIKTETCFTMYSNLRTEGSWNNHLFMPALRLGGWQTDLVEIMDTDLPQLTEYVETGDLITFFELRRIVSQTPTDRQFFLSYKRGGETHLLSCENRKVTQTEMWGRHPLILGKLLFFRPVPTAECTPCRH